MVPEVKKKNSCWRYPTIFRGVAPVSVLLIDCLRGRSQFKKLLIESKKRREKKYIKI